MKTVFLEAISEITDLPAVSTKVTAVWNRWELRRIGSSCDGATFSRQIA
ncbi:MAG: hypothetical protein IGS38_18165 [Synechococcales cyanobacterium M58_A2018_015]|nr:hypothetical protein [Synechococcales cyanobacterium M58_A2018_015]